MMNGLNNLVVPALLLSLSCAAFLYSVVCLFLYNVKREKLLLKKRFDSINQRGEVQKKVKTATKKKSKLAKLNNTKLMDRLTEMLAVSGIMLKSDEFLVMWILIAVVPAVLAFFVTFQLLAGLAFFIIGVAAPLIFIRVKREKRLTLFQSQLGDSLTIMSNCLRSGLSFQQALESIANEMPQPISVEFSRVLREIRFGSTLDDALLRLVDRMESRDLDLMVSAVIIQRQVGGNLSEILENISVTITDRIRLKQEIKVLTATGRTSGLIVGLLPVGVSLMLMVVNPSYIMTLFNSDLGPILLGACVLLEAIGFIFIGKITNIKY